MPTILLVSHIDDNGSIPELLFDRDYQSQYKLRTESFKIKDFADVPHEFWDSMLLADGIAIDDLARGKRQLGDSSKPRHPYELTWFILGILGNEFYNNCPIFVSMLGLPTKDVLRHWVRLGNCIRTLKQKGINFIVDGDVLVVEMGPTGKKRIVRRRSMNWETPAQSFWEEVKRHHTEHWQPLEVRLTIRGM